MALPRFFRSPALAVGLGALALAVGLAALGDALTNSSAPAGSAGTVEVNATGTATGSPNVLNVQLAVITKASSAAAALNKNNTEMHHLQAVFVGAGVAIKDLQTSNLDVSPTYNQTGSITGYGAEDDLSATLRSIAKSGAVIDAAENAVGNDVTINGITFSFSNDAPLMQQARVSAMKNARAQAADFAKGADEQLGSVLRISTSVNTPSPLPFNGAVASPGIKATPVPIRSGTETESVSVDVVFALH